MQLTFRITDFENILMREREEEREKERDANILYEKDKE